MDSIATQFTLDTDAECQRFDAASGELDRLPQIGRASTVTWLADEMLLGPAPDRRAEHHDAVQ
jgi:hypothetical protein